MTHIFSLYDTINIIMILNDMNDVPQTEQTQKKLEVAIYSYYKWKVTKLSKIAVHDDNQEEDKESTTPVVESNIDSTSETQQPISESIQQNAESTTNNTINTITTATSTSESTTTKLMYDKYMRIIDVIEQEFPDYPVTFNKSVETYVSLSDELHRRFIVFPKIYSELFILQNKLSAINVKHSDLQTGYNKELLEELKQQRDQLQNLANQQHLILLQQQVWQTEKVLQVPRPDTNSIINIDDVRTKNNIDEADQRNNKRKRQHDDTSNQSTKRRETSDSRPNITHHVASAKKSQRTSNELRVLHRGPKQAKVNKELSTTKNDIGSSDDKSDDESVCPIKLSKLPADKIQNVNHLDGTDYNFPSSFTKRVQLLENYVEKYKHCKPTPNTGHDYLIRWIFKLRARYLESQNTVNPDEFLKKIGLTRKRLNLVCKIGCFDWLPYPKIRKINTEQTKTILDEKNNNSNYIAFSGYDPLRFPKTFEGRFGVLNEFYNEVGHCFVPKRYKKLSYFVNRLRYEYRLCEKNPELYDRPDLILRQEQLNTSRMKLLQDIDFPFVTVQSIRGDFPKTAKTMLEQKLDQHNPNFIVFNGYDPLNFPTTFEGRFGVLNEFYKEVGHCFVPKRFKLLSNFVNRVRSEYRLCQKNPELFDRDEISLRQDQINTYRMKLLQDIDFPFVSVNTFRCDNPTHVRQILDKNQIDQKEHSEHNNSETSSSEDDEDDDKEDDDELKYA